MNGITLTNDTDRRLTLIVEPIANEYAFGPGDKVELRPPLFLDHRKVIDIQLKDHCLVVFAPEEVDISRDGKPLPREGE